VSDDFDAELARLASATADLRPKPGFEERVLAGLPSARDARWDVSVLRFGKALLVVAALSAVIGVVVGVQSDRDEEQTTASTYGMEELDL
jgi:hypothetical protein